MSKRKKASPKERKHKTEAPVPTMGPSVDRDSIILAVLLWMSEASKGEDSRRRLSLLESKIKTHYAEDSLEQLIVKRCDRDTLLRSLGFACGKPADHLYDNWFTKFGPQSVHGLFGLDGRGFSALQRKLAEAADHIESMNRRFEFGVLLTTPHLQVFQGLPNGIRSYVSLLELAAKQLARGAHIYRNVGKAILTSYVRQQTGRVHDEEVSALLAAVEDSDKYSAGSQLTWREEHKDLLASVSRFVPIFASEAVRSAIKNL